MKKRFLVRLATMRRPGIRHRLHHRARLAQGLLQEIHCAKAEIKIIIVFSFFGCFYAFSTNT